MSPRPRPRFAYVCQDPGIRLHGNKGASVHLREFGRALAAEVGDVVPTTIDDISRSRGELDTWKKSADASTLMDLTCQQPFLEQLAAKGPYDAVYERYSLLGLAGTTLARAAGLPHVLEVNAPLWAEAARYRGLTLVDLAASVGRTVMQNADAVLCVSRVLVADLLELGLDEDRVHHFPNAVPYDRFASISIEARPPTLGSRPTVLFAGSLKPWHGLPALLELLRHPRLGEFGLWVVGDGPLREDIARAVEEFPDRVVWEGAVPHERMPGFYAAADFSVAPYAADAPAYFCPLKVLESLAAGTPVVSSRGLDLGDDEPWGDAILRYDATQPGALADALGAVLGALDSHQVSAQKARDRILARHCWTHRARTLPHFITGSVRGLRAASGGTR